jgi:hypothetical protein
VYLCWQYVGEGGVDVRTSIALAFALVGAQSGVSAQKSMLGEIVKRRDIQCPEGVDVTPAGLPSGWKIYMEGENGETMYWAPGGELSTWCEYSQAIWKRQEFATRHGGKCLRESRMHPGLRL